MGIATRAHDFDGDWLIVVRTSLCVTVWNLDNSVPTLLRADVMRMTVCIRLVVFKILADQCYFIMTVCGESINNFFFLHTYMLKVLIHAHQ